MVDNISPNFTALNFCPDPRDHLRADYTAEIVCLPLLYLYYGADHWP